MSMLNYKAPLRDMRFVMNEVFDYPAHYRALGSGEDASPEVVDAILEAAATYCEEVLAPLYVSGGEEGCHFQAGEVTTPKGFKAAYAQFVEGGWQGLSFPTAYGGQGLPVSLNLLKSEMMGTANWAFSMYPGLSIGCINTILQYGTEAMRQQYLPKLVAGEWGGTMCLTEPQCGSDLAQVKTQAKPLGDGSYAITGTKIFISSGEHDLTDNIVHIVLARLPEAPAGTRGHKRAASSAGKASRISTISATASLAIKFSSSADCCFSTTVSTRLWCVAPWPLTRPSTSFCLRRSSRTASKYMALSCVVWIGSTGRRALCQAGFLAGK
jgi:alkylation response protein AidB-like acyl-CoA dehydrogenase